MTDRTLSWTLPTPTATQAEISHVLIDQRVSASFPWANITQVNADQPQQLFLPDVNPGTIYYRVQVVDVTGQIGPGVEAQGNLAFDPPGVVANLTVVDA